MGGPHPPLPPSIEGQTYCLRWNNHKSNLVEILDALIKVESYVDCTIVVDDQVQFKAHRVVLAANSPYFQAILQDVPMDHCSIIFPGVKAFEMRALLDYMYTGEVNVTQSQIPTIMRIAEELEVKGLFDMADLKEKFNKLNEEHAERPHHGYPYNTIGASGLVPPYAMASNSSSALGMPLGLHNGAKDHIGSDLPIPPPHNSSSVISTSSNISPSAAPSSSSSPPYRSYKSPYSNLYSKSPGPSNCGNTNTAGGLPQPKSTHTPQTPTHTQSQSSSGERSQWPLSPSAAVSMLGSVYESVPDNPLKRKKLSSMTSMLMNRDTPILRNVLAQTNPTDSSQSLPFTLPGTCKTEKLPNAEKTSTQPPVAPAHNNSHNFNGEYSNDKKYQDEPHSPYTDRSFDDDGYDSKGNYGGNFSSNCNSNSNQKPEWKRYKQYTRSDILAAIQCVREGMNAMQASRKFGVPSRTLYDKVKKLGITTGRPMNRTSKRSPSNVDSSAAFSYPHNYGAEPMMPAMHESRSNEEREPKEHHRAEHHHIPPPLQHSLLDHALLQQALESRAGDISGHGALLLAAAAHAAVNRISTSPGPNGSSATRTPSPPTYRSKYGHADEHDMILEQEREQSTDREKGRRMQNMEMNIPDREREHQFEMEIKHERELERELERDRFRERDRQRERELVREREREPRSIADDDDCDDHVEDLSVTREKRNAPEVEHTLRYAPSPSYSPPPQLPPGPSRSSPTLPAATTECITAPVSGVIVPPMKLAAAAAAASATAASNSRCSSSNSNSGPTAATSDNSANGYNDDDTAVAEPPTGTVKNEYINSDDGRAD